ERKLMLILQRRVGERIVLGGGIEIKVVSVKGRSVRFAVEAPRGVSVMRGEVHDAMARGEEGPHRLVLRGTRFGNLEIGDERVILFREGLVGFPGENLFVLLPPVEGAQVGWLQSIATPALAF